ncbi:MAG TPA: hypothetical protein VG938_17365 [Verrucomicrobiae bacterium]|jgi:hypothetical protein|nr:hypothetical protein [Verrucomicrobiae bacterium]
MRPVSQTVSTAPVATLGYTLHFTYIEPLTNGWLESSTDLTHWEKRNDFTVTNGQWLVKMDPSKPSEFYRAGGEPLP